MADNREPGAAWWLRGAHAQTTWARLARSRRLVTFEREVLTTPDGDELMLDHTPGPAESPRLLLLHGLEGSAHSLHTQGIAFLARRAGWRVMALNFRSCARDPADIRRRLSNRRPRLYHAGETQDFDLLVRLLRTREPRTRLVALGFSLGGNVLLKWLGETAATAANFIDAAVTISVPYDLEVAGRFLERPVGRFYVAHFMSRLKAKAFDLLKRFPEETKHLDARQIDAARTLREFDASVTVPVHGFRDVDDYYTRSSSQRYLSQLTVPTLCISSADDPFYPAEALETARAAASPQVVLQTTSWGGHAGFVSGRWPWSPYYWAEELGLSWLSARVGARAP